MIEITSSKSDAPQIAQATQKKKIFKMTHNDRMGGSVPVWENAKTSKEAVMEQLSKATQSPPETFKNALALSDSSRDTASLHNQPDQEFGFGDIVDMVNPLHHVPVVGHIYREISGDEIKPIAQIIGGGVFGGPAGAASGIVNTIIEEETGHDLTGNAMQFVLKGEKPSLKSATQSPEIRLGQAAENASTDANSAEALHDLPGAALSFANLGMPKTQPFSDDAPSMSEPMQQQPTPYSAYTNERTAGYIPTYTNTRAEKQQPTLNSNGANTAALDNRHTREPITRFSLLRLTPLQNL